MPTPYKYQSPFVPLFTKESLERVRSSRQTEPVISDLSSSDSERQTDPSKQDKCTLTEMSSTNPSLYAPEETRYAPVYPLFEEPPEQKGVNASDVETLLFTGASESDIRKALKLYNNDVNEAANWLLLHESYSEESTEEMPSLTSEKATVHWNEPAPSSSSAKSQDMHEWKNGLNDILSEHKSGGTLDSTFREINEGRNGTAATKGNSIGLQGNGHNDDSDAVFGLCEMLGVPYILAQQAMIVFKGT